MTPDQAHDRAQTRLARDYRDDDQRDRGYCPKCGMALTWLTRAARGYCEVHGWVFAEWTPTIDHDSDEHDWESCWHCVQQAKNNEILGPDAEPFAVRHD